MRVAGAAIRTIVASVTLWRGLSHQPGAAASTVLTSTSRDFSRNGPVPLACRVA